MGAVVDTTVFVDLERAGVTAREGLGASIGRRLADQLGPDEEIAIAAITASELLHGVHRATPAHRASREAFVETVLAAVPVLAFDLLAARAHASLWAALASSGRDISPHDRIVAATAISLGWRVVTSNARHFREVPGVDVIEVGSPGRP